MRGGCLPACSPSRERDGHRQPQVFIRRDNQDYPGLQVQAAGAGRSHGGEFGGETYNALDRAKRGGWEKWRKQLKKR